MIIKKDIPEVGPTRLSVHQDHLGNLGWAPAKLSPNV